MKVDSNLRRKVKARAMWALDALQFLHKFELDLGIRYFDHDTAAGYANLRDGMLEFNSILLNENPEEFIRVIVPHEVAHFIDYSFFNPKTDHGPSFRRLMKIMNLPDDACHNFDTDRCPMPDRDRFVYKCHCQHHVRHEVTERTHEQRKIKPIRCTLCNTTLHFSHIRTLRKHK